MIRPIARAEGTRYQAYGRAGGKQVYIGTYDTRREALDAEEDHRVTQRKIARGELAPETDARRTFADGVKAWLAALERASSRSLEEYTTRMNAHMLPRFGSMAIVDIGKPDVVRWRDEMLEKVSGATVNTCMGTLSSAFTWFVDQGWLGANPCARIKRAKHIAKVFPWITTSEAITRLIAECTPAIATLVAVLVGTGMRLDEALHLSWLDVDLEHRIITVHRGRRGTTKGGRYRRVPILDSVLPVLREMKLQRAAGASSLLWPGERGRVRNQAPVRRAFKAAIEHAELPAELRIHDLRHTMASMFLAHGGSLFTLSKILGHSSVAITERTYAHLMPQAFEADYGRVPFRMPAIAPVVALRSV